MLAVRRRRAADGVCFVGSDTTLVSSRYFIPK
jgi:hypothetical protein